jgi:hypothetical protein
MNVEEQKSIVSEVLTKVKSQIDPEAIVAGGAPRNWKDGILANDIDLYLRSFMASTTASRTKAFLENVFFKGESIEFYQDAHMGNYTVGIDLKIVRLVGVVYKGVKFQFIFMRPDCVYRNFKHQIVSHMDIGLNRIWIDWYSTSERGIQTTKEYDIDAANSTLTLYTSCMSDSQLAHCMKTHLPKMQEYYPSYNLIVK